LRHDNTKTTEIYATSTKEEVDAKMDREVFGERE